MMEVSNKRMSILARYVAYAELYHLLLKQSDPPLERNAPHSQAKSVVSTQTGNQCSQAGNPPAFCFAAAAFCLQGLHSSCSSLNCRISCGCSKSTHVCLVSVDLFPCTSRYACAYSHWIICACCCISRAIRWEINRVDGLPVMPIDLERLGEHFFVAIV